MHIGNDSARGAEQFSRPRSATGKDTQLTSGHESPEADIEESKAVAVELKNSALLRGHGVTG
jgi:hypothetical protein